jgi:Xaa-Pro dipeptidase
MTHLAATPFACPPRESGEENTFEGARLFQLNYAMHAEARQKLLKRFTAGGAVPAGSVLLFQGGATETRHETDHEKLFRQESSFNYLFGVKEPDCYGCIEVDNGRTTLFVPRLPKEYEIWMGKIKSTDWFLKEYGVDEVLYVDELKATMTARAKQLYTSRGVNTDSGNYATPATFDGIEAFPNDTTKLYYDIVECRVIKSAEELRLLRYINDIASDAHLEVMKRCRPGMQEFQLESIFKHYCYYEGGCRMDAYTAICGGGINSATLHYGHAGAPNDRQLQTGDMCLLDMGTEYHCYVSDITCSFPANGTFTDDQAAVFNCVLDCQEQVMEAMRPGVPWIDMHALTYKVIAKHLLSIGICRAEYDVETLVAAGLPNFFMPHGLGHYMGLDTHDVGGIPKDQVDSRPKELGYKSLRCLRVLEAGMVITVEPGMYFIDMLMDRLVTEADLTKYVNVEVLERFRNFGGIRLEDDVIITDEGIENMTNCPRTVSDVEAVMNGTIKRRSQLQKMFYRVGDEGVVVEIEEDDADFQEGLREGRAYEVMLAEEGIVDGVLLE